MKSVYRTSIVSTGMAKTMASRVIHKIYVADNDRPLAARNSTRR
jgi:hypothetical protein